MKFGFSGVLHGGGVEVQKMGKVKQREPLQLFAAFPLNTRGTGQGEGMMLSRPTHLICVWNIDLTAS